MDSLKRLVELLTKILREPVLRSRLIKEFQNLVWAGLDPTIPERSRDVLKDLAYDLDFFEESPSLRREDHTYYGHQRLEKEIREALDKLRAEGVVVPDDE